MIRDGTVQETGSKLLQRVRRRKGGAVEREKRRNVSCPLPAGRSENRVHLWLHELKKSIWGHGGGGGQKPGNTGGVGYQKRFCMVNNRDPEGTTKSKKISLLGTVKGEKGKARKTEGGRPRCGRGVVGETVVSKQMPGPVGPGGGCWGPPRAAERKSNRDNKTVFEGKLKYSRGANTYGN